MLQLSQFLLVPRERGLQQQVVPVLLVPPVEQFVQHLHPPQQCEQQQSNDHQQ